MSLFDYLEDMEKKLESEQPFSGKNDSSIPNKPEPISISSLTLNIKQILEKNFRDIWVIGQVSNFSQPRSGHAYLTLKDEGAQLPAVVWKSTLAKNRFQIEDGQELLCRGRIEIYPPQGKYQMIVTALEPKGVGTLELAFRQLHDKLAGEGLFEPARKKPLPKTIRNVAVITSSSGAAIRDFLQVLGRRTRQVDVLLLPVAVQGDGAAAEIAEAIRRVHQIVRIRPVDCIVVTRGGGSTEDLWAFNEEVLVRAVAASTIPIVSGVGHEIDLTLCDLAADVRALTPSEAAERIAPEDSERIRGLLQTQRRLDDLLEKRLRSSRDRLRFLENHSAMQRPEQIVDHRRKTVDWTEDRLERSLDRRVQQARERFAKISSTLDALSPLAVLGRGYSLVENESGKRIRSVREIVEGELIRNRLDDGLVASRVEKIGE